LLFLLSPGTATGELFVWGGNSFAQLGLGDAQSRDAPVQVKLPGKALAVFCGSTFTFAQLDDGRLFAWGDNDNGELGMRNTTPYVSPMPNEFFLDIGKRVTAISCGACHSVALLGALVCFVVRVADKSRP
jgi:alpha-tubulin suppressor-like RCC1 family protein